MIAGSGNSQFISHIAKKGVPETRIGRYSAAEMDQWFSSVGIADLPTQKEYKELTGNCARECAELSKCIHALGNDVSCYFCSFDRIDRPQEV